MDDKYSLREDAFDFFMDATLQDLKNEIAKSKAFVMNARKFKPKYPSHVRDHNQQYDRWKALELLEQLRSGNITREEFDTKVSVEKGIPND